MELCGPQWAPHTAACSSLFASAPRYNKQCVQSLLFSVCFIVFPEIPGADIGCLLKRKTALRVGHMPCTRPEERWVCRFMSSQGISIATYFSAPDRSFLLLASLGACSLLGAPDAVYPARRRRHRLALCKSRPRRCARCVAAEGAGGMIGCSKQDGGACPWGHRLPCPLGNRSQIDSICIIGC